MKFEMIQDVQPLYSIGGWYKEDPDWKITDKNGHEHYYGENFSLPTLNKIEEIEERYSDFWDDVWEDVTVTYKCKRCDEVVVPGKIHQRGPIYQYGRIHYYIDDQLVSKEDFIKRFGEANE